jgi:FlaA1/EpsC-like NDP-sugar epimerase
MKERVQKELTVRGSVTQGKKDHKNEKQQMFRQLKNRNFYLMVVGDMVLFALALVGAYFVRFDCSPSEEMFRQALDLLPYVLPVKIAVFFSFGLYRGMWRYSSLSDIWGLLKATVLSTLLIISGILFVHHFHGYSRGVFLIDAVLTFLFTGGLRIGIRFLYYEGFLEKTNGNETHYRPRLNRKNVILVGAGDAGEMTFRELAENPSMPYHVVAFVDDDRTKQGRLIHGVPVRGPVTQLPFVVTELGAQEIFITLPSATGPQMRRIVDICESCGVPYKTLPGLGELIDGRVSVKALRDVSYEDLLGRVPVRLDMSNIAEYLTGRSVLVTGCGGSIGSELCRQIIHFDPGELVLMDASEANLYQIQMELKHEKRFKRYFTILGKVTDRQLTESVFAKYRPEVVFHAAAYKHVPMLERNPWEAVFNNILGSKVAMESAAKYGVKRFVLVSTDKAVRPTNVMGASKRVTELIMWCLQNHSTRFMAVRFGNVVGSSGSVVPLFRRQIARGGPVTVTHSDVTRYFMTIPEAAQLILQTGSMGKGGEIFILEMGGPVKIVDMARDLIRLSGKEPEKDIEIVFTGLREGAKLYEELITVGEGIVPTPHEKIMVLHSNGQINGHKSLEGFRRWLDKELMALSDAANRFDAEAIKMKLKEIVPEYKPFRNK